MFKQNNKCLLCNSHTREILNLGKTPLANELLDTNKEPDLFPLGLIQCKRCKHLQLDTLVDEERLYSNYLYVANNSEITRKHFNKYANDMMDRFDPKNVLDIGSNDGLLLSFFQKYNVKVLGVDPAENIVDQANKNNIPTICSFFNDKFAQSLDEKFDLITCNNCFAHNKDLKTMARGIKSLLSNRGIFVFEVSYAMDLLNNNLFDLIYHEHIHHWHLGATMKFFNYFKLEVFDAQKIDVHGGSIRVFVKHKTDGFKSGRLKVMLKQEHQIFQNLVDLFPIGVSNIKKQLVNTLQTLKKQNKTISILGCPAKAATLSSYFGLDKEIITDVFDDNSLKIGRYSPQGIKIKSTKEIENCKPDYLLILSWNYSKELMERFKGNKFIVPLPGVKVYE